MRQIGERDLGWIAGIVDGEGCLSMGRHLRESRELRYNFHPIVYVKNTQMVMLTHLTGLTGIGIIDPHKSEKGKNWKPTWIWRLRQDEARGFLPVIMPYLIVKQRQAELLLEYLRMTRGRAGTRQIFSEAEERKATHIYWDLLELNKRGQ